MNDQGYLFLAEEIAGFLLEEGLIPNLRDSDTFNDDIHPQTEKNEEFLNNKGIFSNIEVVDIFANKAATDKI